MCQVSFCLTTDWDTTISFTVRIIHEGAEKSGITPLTFFSL